MNEMVEVPLPTAEERIYLLMEYLDRNVIERAEQKTCTNVTISPELEDPESYDRILKEMASDEKTGGMSGREIEKMCSSIFVSIYHNDESSIIICPIGVRSCKGWRFGNRK